jgi:hypothetical protein
MAQSDDKPALNSPASPESPESSGGQSDSDSNETVTPSRKHGRPGSANSKYKGSEAKNMRRRIMYALKKNQLPREAYLRSYNSLTPGIIDNDLLKLLNEVRRTNHLPLLTPAAFRAQFTLPLTVAPFRSTQYDALMDPLNEQSSLIDKIQQKCEGMNKTLATQNKFRSDQAANPPKTTTFAKSHATWIANENDSFETILPTLQCIS